MPLWKIDFADINDKTEIPQDIDDPDPEEFSDGHKEEIDKIENFVYDTILRAKETKDVPLINFVIEQAIMRFSRIGLKKEVLEKQIWIVKQLQKGIIKNFHNEENNFEVKTEIAYVLEMVADQKKKESELRNRVGALRAERDFKKARLEAVIRSNTGLMNELSHINKRRALIQERLRLDTIEYEREVVLRDDLRETFTGYSKDLDQQLRNAPWLVEKQKNAHRKELEDEIKSLEGDLAKLDLIEERNRIAEASERDLPFKQFCVQLAELYVKREKLFDQLEEEKLNVKRLDEERRSRRAMEESSQMDCTQAILDGDLDDEETLLKMARHYKIDTQPLNDPMTQESQGQLTQQTCRKRAQSPAESSASSEANDEISHGGDQPTHAIPPPTKRVSIVEPTPNPDESVDEGVNQSDAQREANFNESVMEEEEEIDRYHVEQMETDEREEEGEVEMEEDEQVEQHEQEESPASQESNSLADKKIDFTVKSHLTDVTFVIDGKKIYAGRDFLSIYSSFFNTLLKGNFRERTMEEIELKDVYYDDFLKMLVFLVDDSKKIEACDVESLLLLGDRFDIKCMLDRAEEFLIKSEKEFSISMKLLLADRYRLIKLQTLCCNSARIFNKAIMEIRNSEEFALLSESAKTVFKAAVYEFLNDPENLVQVEKIEEPVNGFIAMESRSFNFSKARNLNVNKMDICGLKWIVELQQYVGRTPFGRNSFSFDLIVNHNLKSNVDWSAEGFVEVKVAMVSSRTGEESLAVTNTFAFSLSNSNRAGSMIIPAKTEKYKPNRWNTHAVFVTIYVTKVTGVRRSPVFDFTVPSDLTDAVFIVEGKKIHVNKQFLSTISPRFLKMFYDTNEVEVKDVNHKEFLEYMHWIYPSDRRYMTVSSLFSVHRVADKLEVDVDNLVIYDYILNIQVGIAEKFIFFFEFNCDSREDLLCLKTYYEEGWTDGKHAGYSYNVVKKCPLLARMSPEKKAKMYEFMFEETLAERVECASDEIYDSEDEDMEESD